jgi:hypothetical protein
MIEDGSNVVILMVEATCGGMGVTRRISVVFCMPERQMLIYLTVVNAAPLQKSNLGMKLLLSSNKHPWEMRLRLNTLDELG